MIKVFFVVFLLGLISMANPGFAQEYYRISADFSVKVKNSEGQLNLTRGKLFYDKNYKELIYDVNFPQIEKWVVKDTSLFKIRQDTIFARQGIPSITEFTIFHLALNSDLNDFGLRNSIYKISKVEKKDDLVLSYWKIPVQAKSEMDHVVVAKKDNRLESVIIVGHDLKIMSKQYFRNYIRIEGFEFPQQIVQVLYDENNNENYQVTEFKNINLNDLSNSESYHTNL